MARIAVVFPGQGAHRAGMASAWAGNGPAERVLDGVAAATGLDIAALADDAAACERTEVAQPAIFAVSLATHRALQDAGIEADVVAGHSLGEVTAAVAAGCLSLRDGAVLVAERGRAMGAACAAHPGTMTAVLGLDDHDRDALTASLPEGVALANENSPGQVVLSGPSDPLGRAEDMARQRGARVRRLEVEGAFHSPAMAPAVDSVRRLVAEWDVADPTVPLVTGVSGDVLQRGDDVARALVDGILSPVRWRDVQQTLSARDIDLILDAGPGGILRGLARRSVEVPAIAVDGPDGLAAALEAVDQQAPTGAGGSP